MRNQYILPELAIIAYSMVCSVTTPLYCCLFLGLYLSAIDIAACFHLKHINAIRQFCYKVRLILQVITTPPVKNLELALGWSEPFQRFAFENHCEFSL